MASVQLAPLNLNNKGKRRQGMTRQTGYASLHGGRLARTNNEKESTSRRHEGWEEEDVCAPPKSSSDEEEEVVDDSELEMSKTKKAAASSIGTTSGAESGRIGVDPALNKNKSKARSAGMGKDWTEGNTHKNPKRKSDRMSEDDEPFVFSQSQSRKTKKTYSAGRRVKNIHEPATEMEAGKKKRVALKEDNSSRRKKPNGFVTHDDEMLLARAPPKFKEFDAPPLSSQSTSQVSEVPMFKAFDALPPEKEVEPPRRLKLPRESIPEAKALSRKTRASKKRDPLTNNANCLNNQKVIALALESSRKLGIPDLSQNIPTSSALSRSSHIQSSSNSVLSSPPSSLLDDEDEHHPPRLSQDSVQVIDSSPANPAASQVSRCPLCKASVDTDFFSKFAGKKRLTIREQTSFCRAHKHKSAQDEWTARGYPEIDWAHLNDRIASNYPVIQEILEGTKLSHYRNIYEDFIKKAKHKTAGQTLAQGSGVEDLTPGYYGSRGSRIMIDNLMTHFSTTLWSLAPTDPLISSSGGSVISYVQAVLVPEMASLLVMQDLGVDAPRAREILKQGIDLGGMLWEEEEDAVGESEAEDE